VRLFVGIALDAATRAACANTAGALQRTGFAAKFEDPEKLHATLAFLGNVADDRCEAIVEAMRRVASESRAFGVTFDKLGAFPNERRPRVVYVGARDQGSAFRGLSKRLRSAYAAMGFTFHDDAVAHVTIARVKDPQGPLPLVEVAPQSLHVTELTLFESVFDKEKKTSRYITSATSKFGTSED
jgi:2'-5' RNA ligase